jgi:hypothetical protein
MIQYKLYRKADNDGPREWSVFSDLATKQEFIKDYLVIEDKYVEIVSQIIRADSLASFKVEFQFLHALNTDLIGYYSEIDLDAYNDYTKYSLEEIYSITKEALPGYIRLILRENINAIILTSKNIPLFGYINDFETIVYADCIDKELINEINKNGFIIREFDFSFEMEG